MDTLQVGGAYRSPHPIIVNPLSGGSRLLGGISANLLLAGSIYRDCAIIWGRSFFFMTAWNTGELVRLKFSVYNKNNNTPPFPSFPISYLLL